MLPPAPVSTLMWGEVVPLLLVLAGSCTVVYASLHSLCGTDIIYHYLFSVGVSHSSIVDCINEQFIICGCIIGVNCSASSGYGCHIGLDTIENYLILRAVVLAYVYGISFTTPARVVAAAPRWASGLPML